jgi:Ca-activated chloride channel family protein
LASVAIEEVNRVILWMSATDEDRHFVTDLGRDDLRILEDGVAQTLIDFHAEERPLNIAILLDTSGSMVGRIDEVHAAASAFVDALRPDDRALVIDFNDKVFLIQDLTGDAALLKEAITSTTAIGGTAIFDALHAAYRKLDGIDGRRVIVLLSDGTDSASQFSFERVAEEARAKNVLIYSIALGGGAGDPPRKRVLQEFSDVTGGRFYFVKTATELGDVYRRIAEELGRQYYITYSTKNEAWDGRWIKVEVEALRPGIEIRSRRGYFAVRRELD